jgi:hypothetical protein
MQSSSTALLQAKVKLSKGVSCYDIVRQQQLHKLSQGEHLLPYIWKLFSPNYFWGFSFPKTPPTVTPPPHPLARPPPSSTGDCKAGECMARILREHCREDLRTRVATEAD